MRVTTKGRYALRAIVNLAKNSDGKPVSIKRISQDEEISADFLEQIFFRLKNAGLIRSVRGPGGGFLLDRPAASISMQDIFLAVGEGVNLTPCITCKESSTSNRCAREEKCLVHAVWNKVSGEVSQILRDYTVELILENLQAGRKMANS